MYHTYQKLLTLQVKYNHSTRLLMTLHWLSNQVQEILYARIFILQSRQITNCSADSLDLASFLQPTNQNAPITVRCL